MEFIKLDKIATIVTGGTPSTENKDYWTNGTIPWLQSGCCQDCFVNEASKYITKEGYDNSSTRLMPKDTILIALTGSTAGKIGYLTFEACGNQSITGITPNNDYLPKYIFYYLKSIRSKILSDCIGGAQPHISQGYVKNIEIPVRSICEQKAIVNILDECNSLIKDCLSSVDSLDKLIQSRFIEMFGERHTNNMNWNTELLDKLVEFHNGKAHEKVIDDNGKYILVTSKAISSDMKDYRRTNVCLSPLNKNDICMVMSDVPNGRALAKCFLINDEGKYTLNQRICCFKNYKFNSIFLFHLLNRHEYLLSFDTGQNQTNLRKEDILNCPIIMPPLNLQNNFASFVEQIDKSKSIVQKQIDLLQELLDKKMNEYFA